MTTELDLKSIILDNTPAGKSNDPLVQEIINKLAKRSNKGILKYKNTMVQAELTIDKWLDNAIEELLDAAVYLTKIQKELAKNKTSWKVKFAEDLLDKKIDQNKQLRQEITDLKNKYKTI